MRNSAGFDRGLKFHRSESFILTQLVGYSEIEKKRIRKRRKRKKGGGGRRRRREEQLEKEEEEEEEKEVGGFVRVCVFIKC